MLTGCTVLNSTSTERYKFMQGPETRGTMDIIWTCLITMILAVYSSCHSHYETRHWKGSWRNGDLDKTYKVILNLVHPEQILVDGCGRSLEAHIMQKKMLAKGFENWTVSHGLFTFNGGFVYRDSRIDPGRILDISRTSIIKYARPDGKFGTITKGDLFDRTNTTYFIKLFTMVQLIWFFAACLGRFVQGLPVSLLEIYTITQVAWSVSSYTLWWHCPQDVSIPIEIDRSAFDTSLIVNSSYQGDLNSFVTNEGDDGGPAYTVVDMDDDVHSKYASLLEKIADDDEDDVVSESLWLKGEFKSGRTWFYYGLMAVPIAVFYTTLSMPWILDMTLLFPSKAERYIWISALVAQSLSTSILIFGALNYYFLEIQQIAELGAVFDVSWFLLSLFAKVILLVEACISLRSLPEGVFMNVKWESYIPHF